MPRAARDLLARPDPICSARIVPSTGGRRTTVSSACVPSRPLIAPSLTSAPQFDPIDREGMEAPLSAPNKDGVYQCKKHASTCACRVHSPPPPYPHDSEIRPPPSCTMLTRNFAACSQCYGWKKQITRLRTAAKKAGKK